VSKAFTRETDDERQPVPQHRPRLPSGVKNYLTPDGERRLRAQLEQLTLAERPRLAALAEDSDAKSRLAALDQRIAKLQRGLADALVTPPPPKPWDTVRFGAFVTVRDQRGAVETYRIVGIEELDLNQGWVSFLSPLAKALLNARLGQRVRFRSPSGEAELEITAIDYRS